MREDEMSDVPDLDELVGRARAAVAGATATEEIRTVAASLTGKKSALAQASRSLGGLEPDARRELGRRLNEARTSIEQLIEDRRREIAERELAEEMARSRIDLTEFVPGSLPAPVERGHLNLVSRTQAALEDVFVGMGFEVEEGPEACGTPSI
jgi:phenylalanyl-tRNA synthetase alpha chain